MSKRPYELPDGVPNGVPDDERPTPPDPNRTPADRPSAKRPYPDSFYPTPKPEPSAPRASPRPNTSELLEKANEAERELSRPGWDKTNPGNYATNGYAKSKAKFYAALAFAVSVGIQIFDHTAPMLVELYEKHLDRQAQRAALKAGP